MRPGARLGMLLAGLLLANSVAAKDPWVVLDHPVPTGNPDKIEIVELFWYGCPHCFHLEPYLASWVEAKPDFVEFVRIPAIFRADWIPLARAYYTMEQLGVTARLHSALFEAIHVKGQNMNNEGALRKFFGEHGVSGEDFDAAYNGFAVDALVRKAAQRTRDYRITGVPSMVVNGKFVTNATLNGGHEALLKTVTKLALAEHKRQLAATAAPPLASLANSSDQAAPAGR